MCVLWTTRTPQLLQIPLCSARRCTDLWLSLHSSTRTSDDKAVHLLLHRGSLCDTCVGNPRTFPRKILHIEPPTVPRCNAPQKGPQKYFFVARTVRVVIMVYDIVSLLVPVQTNLGYFSEFVGFTLLSAMLSRTAVAFFRKQVSLSRIRGVASSFAGLWFRLPWRSLSGASIFHTFSP